MGEEWLANGVFISSKTASLCSEGLIVVGESAGAGDTARAFGWLVSEYQVS
jgi:hypothetical protein